MKFFYKLERKYGKYAIPNLMQYMVIMIRGAALLKYILKFWQQVALLCC